MRLKSFTFTLAMGVIFAVVLVPAAMAGTTGPDGDLDGVPDAFDNCVNDPNGPDLDDSACGQIDTDDDGFGNWCDPDFDNADGVQFNDFQDLLTFLGTSDSPEHDLNCEFGTQFDDFQRLLVFLGSDPG